MDVQISEIRPEELPQVRQLFAQRDVAEVIGPPMSLTLVARHGDAIVAAIVCMRGEDGYHCRHAVAEQCDDTGVVKSLVDKALLKLNSHRIHKCRIQMDEAFFGHVRWTTDSVPAASAEPQAVEPDAEEAAPASAVEPPAPVADEQRTGVPAAVPDR